MSPEHAALSIMAGALTNTTQQGLIDAALVNSRLAAASQFTASLNTPADVATYVGGIAASIARTMLATVTNATDPATVKPMIDTTIAER